MENKIGESVMDVQLPACLMHGMQVCGVNSGCYVQQWVVCIVSVRMVGL